jgi:peptidoglycan/LPS O-acetylase OafA/YrhL
MPVAWSLHVELVFYLALPLIAWLCVAAPGRSVRPLAVLVAIGLLSLAARSVWPDLGDSHVRGALGPMLLWAFVPGMLVALAMSTAPSFAARLSERRVGVVGGLMLILPVVLLWNDHGHVELARMVLVCTGTALLIPSLLRWHASSRWAVAMATAGRTLSYPFYLWHLTLLLIVANLGGRGWPALALTGAVALVISAVSWHLVERPASDLARRLVHRSPMVDERPQVLSSGVAAS